MIYKSPSQKNHLEAFAHCWVAKRAPSQISYPQLSVACGSKCYLCHMPYNVRPLGGIGPLSRFGGSSIAVAALVAVVLNLVLPRQK